MVAAGATRLLSFGLAGGLDPTLAPGTLVLASDVICDGVWLPTDARWRGSFAATDWVQGPLLAADAPLLDRHAKLAAFAATGAVAVDMESGAVARVAAQAGLPFVAVRAVADPAWRSVPERLVRAVDGQGRIRPLAAVLAAALHPLSALLLAADARAALAALRAAAALYRSAGR
jgi:hypothetical protein